MRCFRHGRYWSHWWPGEDNPPETPLWRAWLPLWLACWGVVALMVAGVLYGLPWLADKVLP